MLYASIRLILAIVVAAIVFLILKHKKFQFTPRRILFLFLGMIGIYYIFMFIRFENIFMSFPSAEAVWRYENVGEIQKVIQGKDSSLVIYKSDKGVYVFSIYPKSTEGWKLNNYLFDKAQSKTIGNPIKCVAYLFKTQRSNDCYIFVDKFITLEISDNIGSNFKKIIIDSEDPYENTYFAIIPVIEQYELTVGHETTVLDLK